MADNIGEEARDGALTQTNQSIADESVVDDLTEGENSEDDQVEDGQSSLNDLLLGMAEDKQPSEAGLDKLHSMLSLMDKKQVNAQDVDGKSALQIAVKHGLVTAANALINAGAEVSEKDTKGRQHLHKACLEGYTGMVKLLLEKGADIEAKQHRQATPLDEACWMGHIDVVDILLDKNANTQVTDEDRWSPLYSASRYGHEQVVRRLLLADKSNLDATATYHRWTALHAATFHGHEGAVSALLENGARLDIKDNNERTPLMTAILQRHSNITRKLLIRRSNEEDTQLETIDKSRRTPLISASLNGFLDGAVQLIAAGANCNAQSMPLHLASHQGNEYIVKLLLEAGAPVDAADKDGKTALHLASGARAKNPSQRTVNQLGADGLTPEERHKAEFQSGRDSKKYQLPRPSKGLSSILESFEATVVQFYKGPGESGTIRRYRPVQQVIYDLGPAHIMKTTISDLRGIISSKSDLSDSMMYLKTEPRFTWVHLPATNMPYFCFSSQCQDETSSQGDAKDKNRLQRLLEAKESYKGLLGAYESSAIHGSTTLDEWYYHFADDGESAGDQKYRNKNQVVTKFLMVT
ncbi:hypothetical protein ACJ41O_000153 [Fusarium nematophilum]